MGIKCLTKEEFKMKKKEIAVVIVIVSLLGYIVWDKYHRTDKPIFKEAVTVGPPVQDVTLIPECPAPTVEYIETEVPVVVEKIVERTVEVPVEKVVLVERSLETGCHKDETSGKVYGVIASNSGYRLECYAQLDGTVKAKYIETVRPLSRQ